MVTKSDKEKYAELVATAYKKLMDIAESDPNAVEADEDEMEEL
jgi:hypothetical protein